jgi:hypothetical protein
MTWTKEEIARFEAATACEDYFPGVLGNPVTFAARWGLPLSRSYLKELDRRKKENQKAAAAKQRSSRAK